MSRAEKVGELSQIYSELYEDEPEDNYDMDGAREYWRLLPLDQLEQELVEAREKLATYHEMCNKA